MLFQDKRFGMFIHWGIYSIHGWHEQEQWRYPLDSSEYVKLMNDFNPQEYDPDSWVELAAQAGMDYICFATKHHDGFCMWDTKYTDFNIMNTPYGKDVLKMLADACHRRGMGLSLYYSIPDWHHPNYPNQNWDHELATPKPGDFPDEERYIEYVKAQVKELCTGYGKIESFFWDIPPLRRDASINQIIRELQPGIMINDRGYDSGDFDTPERNVPEGGCFSRYTEACQSVGRQSWGFRANEDYYAHKFLVKSIDKIMAMGGNYLLNVGPAPDGTIPGQAAASVKRVGEWYNKVRESLYNAKPASFLMETEGFLLTARENTLYIHLCNEPESTGLILESVVQMPRSAVVLNNHQKLYAGFDKMPTLCMPPDKGGEVLHINGIPVNELSGEVIVLKLEFEDLKNAVLKGGRKTGEFRF